MKGNGEQGEARRGEAAEDYYYEGEYLVFTEAYHRKRGYCCQSECRHCPWRVEKDPPGYSKSSRN